MTKKLCIISGSTLGNAEEVAEALCESLENEDASLDIFHGPNLDEVKDYSYWLIVTSTYGAGDIPDNLLPLFQTIIDKNLDLSHVKFGIVGLGDSNYDTYCHAVDKATQILKDHFATEIVSPVKIDVTTTMDPESVAEEWLPSFLLNYPSDN